VAAVFYLLTVTGITVGYHRHFTHRSFKTGRTVRIMLAVLGSMALQGPVITWVADHRRHHAFADEQGDRTRPGCSAPPRVRWQGLLARRTRAPSSKELPADQRRVPVRGETDDAH
jgi:fatty-acid desaturase